MVLAKRAGLENQFQPVVNQAQKTYEDMREIMLRAGTASLSLAVVFHEINLTGFAYSTEHPNRWGRRKNWPWGRPMTSSSCSMDLVISCGVVTFRSTRWHASCSEARP